MNVASLRFVVSAIALGILATVIMDVGGALGRLSGLTQGTPPPLMGKWILGVFRGEFAVDDIRTSPGPVPSMGTFLAFHYAIGVLLAVTYALVLRASGMGIPPWWLSLAYGMGTTVFAAFAMFPGMGFGVLGLQGPSEFQLLRTALINHAVYGLGLVAGIQLLGARLLQK